MADTERPAPHFEELDERSYLERRQDEIDESHEIEAAEWEARDRFIEGYDA